MRATSILTFCLLLAVTAAGCRTEPKSTSRDRSDRSADTPDTGAVSTSAETSVAEGVPTAVITTTGAVTPTSGESGTGAVLGDAIATVNGEQIPLAEFQRQVFDTQRFYVEQGLDPNTEEGQSQLLHLRKQVLDDMINQVLVEQAARELGVVATEEDIAARMASYVEQFGSEDALAASLSETGTSKDEIAKMERASIIGQKMLDKITADVPTTAEFVHARHILCDSQEACTSALERLAAGESFATVATDVSKDDTSAQRGGDLDWVARGMLPSQQLEDEIFRLAPGERSGVVATDFGFHVIEVIERDASRELSVEQRYTLREKRLMEWLADRRRQSHIEVFVADLRDLETAPS
jgi:parvulin-like peptidyl-prolyl isomerase